jgi:flavin-binding protein dodecin
MPLAFPISKHTAVTAAVAHVTPLVISRSGKQLRERCDFMVGPPFWFPATRKSSMTGHIYRIIEIAGSSEVSHADAIDRAVERAAETLKHLRWVEVKEQRGEIEGGRIRNYQVILKVGFTIED